MAHLFREDDVLLVTVPKRKRIRNRALRKRMREDTPWCERCGKPSHGGAHHIKYQSQSGDDVRENLIMLCFDCHRGIHDARYKRDELLAIVAQREGKTITEIAEIIRVAL